MNLKYIMFEYSFIHVLMIIVSLSSAIVGWVNRSVEDAAFISGDHIFNVDEGVFSSVDLEHLEGLLDQVAQVKALPLAVIDLVTQVEVLDLEQVEDGQDLPVIGHEGLTNGVRAGDQCL